MNTDGKPSGERTNAPPAERTNARGKPPPQRKSRPAGHGPRKIEPETQPSSAKSDDNDVERPGALGKKFVELLRNMRVAGLSMDQIARICKVSKSTVHFHTADVEPAAPVETNNGGQELQTPEPLRPEIIQPQLNQPEPQLSPPEDEVAAPEPDLMTRHNSPPSIAGDQDWSQVHLLLAGAAWTAGYSNVLDYFRDVIQVDLRTVDLLKTSIPHTDVETLRKNLVTIVKKAGLYDRMHQHAVEEAKQELERNHASGGNIV